MDMHRAVKNLRCLFVALVVAHFHFSVLLMVVPKQGDECRLVLLRARRP